MSYSRVKHSIVWMMVLSCMLWFSFAQSNDCNTCGSTAEPLQDYIDMVSSIMNTMQTQAPEWPMVWAYTTPGLFGGGILELDNESRDVIQRSLDAIGRSIDQKMQARIAVTTVLFTNVWDISRDNLVWIGLLTQNQAIVRDRSKIQRLSSIMQDKIFELALSTARQEPLTLADREQIQTILTAYKDDELLSEVFLSDKATYANTIFVFQKINRSLERFLTYGSIDPFKNDFSAWWDDGISIQFNRQKMEQMKIDYQCARFGDQCAGNFKQFVQDIETIWGENIQAARNSWRDITDAMKKLAWSFQLLGKQTTNFFKKQENKAAYTSEEKAVLSRQQQLLRTVYGSDFKMLQTAILPTIRANIDPSAFVVFKDAMVDITAGVKSDFAMLRNLRETDPDARTIDNFTALQVPWLSDVMKESLTQTMVAVHGVSTDMMQYATITEPHNVTIYVPLLASQLDTLRDIIGTKDTKGMIVHNLGIACELQCSNAGGTCWW